MNGSGHQRRVSYRLLLMILWATLLVFAIELTAGWVSHSLCLLAESLHILIDVFSTLLSLVAVASPQRTLGKEIWGHGRGEAAGALVMSAVLGFAGISIIMIAFTQFESALQLTRGAFPVTVTLPLIILIWVMSGLVLAAVLVAKHQSQRSRSLALKLNTQHILSDAWLTGVMLVGLMLIGQGYRWIDPFLAIVLVLFAIKSLWQMLQAQLPMLLKPTAIAPEAIAQLACQVEGVTRCTRILSRGMVGRQVWIELHLALHPEYMMIAKTIGERIERSLREHYGPVCAQIWLDNSFQETPSGKKIKR
ncbi:MAG: cation diffusion facilitator family transporter [Cyanobacteria bacterium J06597_16]